MIHIISDLHLSAEQKHLTALFEHYVNQISPAAESIYILGDFFEYWIGDDFENAFSQHIESQLKSLSDSGKSVYFIHGNRDFLIGEKFSERTGVKLLDEPHLLTLAGKSCALIHGDSLCTDDIAYQQFRSMVREPSWKNQFLSKSVEERIAIAQSLREQSEMAQKEKESVIMDVNAQAVDQFFTDTDVECLIHGHTHRPASHQLSLSNGNKVTRIVLSDWGEKGQYLSVNQHSIESVYFS